MKRNMLFIVLMLIFCGCTKDTVGEVSNIESSAVAETTEESTTEMQITEPTKQPPSTEIKYPEETKVSDDELNAIQRVMFNLDEFIDTEDETSKKVEELKGKFIFGHDDKDAYCFQRFVYQDLNGDGTKEVIAEATPGYQYIFYVLDGQIYMDTYTYKGMSDIRVDGVYCGDSGANVFYYSKITKLTVEGAVEETLLLKEYSLSGEVYNYLSWDDYNNKINAVSKEEADKIEADISIEKAIVYTFNRENVEIILGSGELEHTEEPTTEIQESDDELSLMELVLLGKSDIYDTEDNQYKKVTELPDYYEEAEFICVDLDGDEILEVILRFSMSSSILHEREGVIYRYPITNRVQYNEDGTISGSSGADYNYLFNIKFEENKMIEEFIYYVIDGKYYSVYEYEGEQIELTEKEIEAIKEQYAEVMIDSYEFNHNNVVTILGNK